MCQRAYTGEDVVNEMVARSYNKDKCVEALKKLYVMGIISSAELSEKLGMDEEPVEGMVESLVEQGEKTEAMVRGEKR